MKVLKTAEYIWLDGTVPVNQIRSKTKIIEVDANPKIEDFPKWNFDGSSTNQAVGKNSDCILQPVCIANNPLSQGNYLVLCEVVNFDGSSHVSNTRAQLRKVLNDYGNEYKPWIGFEQEYTMFQNDLPLGWPEKGSPSPQGPYYCGIGSEKAFGRDLANDHMKACLGAGLIYYGMNAEVMPGQWEFQIGYRGINDEDVGILNISDHIWLARWLLYRISEEYSIDISLNNKPVNGNWNGSGMHTNFSTKWMRDPKTGKSNIDAVIVKLEKKHLDHIAVYGYNLEKRLTGRHETSNIQIFSSGVAHRGSSIRIPLSVHDKGCGYIEDRRPGANADPYIVSTKLIETVCGN